MIIGIDVGNSGGFAILEDGKPPLIGSLPILGGKLDLNLFYTVLYSHRYKEFRPHAVLEDVHAIYGSSAAGTFSFGWGKGAIEGMLVSLGIPYTLVQPKKWQKDLGIIHKPKTTPKLRKEANVAICKKIFPTVSLLATEKSKVPHLGIVDALLIAEWGRRIL